MRVLIDNGRIRNIATGLGQVSVQFASALMRTQQPMQETPSNSAQEWTENLTRLHDSQINFQFLTHPAFATFADHAAKIGAAHIKGKFSPWNKLRRILNKEIFPYIYNGGDHDIRHAAHRNHLAIPSADKTPFVLTQHDMHFMNGNRRSIRRNLKRLRQSVLRADLIAFISKHARDITAESIDLSGKETRIIYNGVDKPQNPRRPQWFRDEMRPFLFSVAQIAAHKNYHILPPMMHHLPGFNLILAGKKKQDGTPLLQNAVAREKMQSRIFAPGVIDENEKAFLLRECAAFVFPSLREGFGMPVIEAFHFGKAVFCFAATALPEVGGAHAFYWQSNNPEEMANTIREHIAPPDAVPRTPPARDQDFDIIAARQKWAQEFSWDKNAAAYIDIYRQLGARQ